MAATFAIIDGGPALSWTGLAQLVWSCLSVPIFAIATWRAKARRYDWATNLSGIGTGFSLVQAFGASLAVFSIGFSQDPSGVQCFSGGTGGICDANGPNWLAFLAYGTCAVLGLAALMMGLCRGKTMKPAPSRRSRGTRRR